MSEQKQNLVHNKLLGLKCSTLQLSPVLSLSLSFLLLWLLFMLLLLSVADLNAVYIGMFN